MEWPKEDYQMRNQKVASQTSCRKTMETSKAHSRRKKQDRLRGIQTHQKPPAHAPKKTILSSNAFQLSVSSHCKPLHKQWQTDFFADFWQLLRISEKSIWNFLHVQEKKSAAFSAMQAWHDRHDRTHETWFPIAFCCCVAFFHCSFLSSDSPPQWQKSPNTSILCKKFQRSSQQDHLQLHCSAQVVACCKDFLLAGYLLAHSTVKTSQWIMCMDFIIQFVVENRNNLQLKQQSICFFFFQTTSGLRLTFSRQKFPNSGKKFRCILQFQNDLVTSKKLRLPFFGQTLSGCAETKEQHIQLKIHAIFLKTSLLNFPLHQSRARQPWKNLAETKRVLSSGGLHRRFGKKLSFYIWNKMEIELLKIEFFGISRDVFFP